jgi:dipeptidase
MRILRHGKSEVKSVQKNGWPICSSATQTSFVVQLRRGVPPDIGIVYWVCLASPCTSVYIPFHFGIADFPAGFRLESQRPSQDLYEQKVTCLFRTDPRQAFWTFSNFHHKIRDASADMVTQAKAQVQRIQKDTFALAKPLEEVAYRLYPQDKMLAMQVLANYSNGIYLSCMDAMSRLLSDASDKSEK